MLKMMKKFYNDESGVTMVEYAMMVALVALAVAAVVILMSAQMRTLFNEVTNCLADKTTCTGYVAPAE
ncbi:MAG: Flp family type IVb pilin [Pseudomonadota bacterium]